MLKRLTDYRPKQRIVESPHLSDYKLSPALQNLLEYNLGPMDYAFNKYTSYAITDKENGEKPANFAVIPNQYFIYAVEMYDFATELFKYFEIYEKIRSRGQLLLGDYSRILNNLQSNSLLSTNFQSQEDMEFFAQFLDKDDDSGRLGSKRLVNDNGKSRGSRDCFGSVILKEINLPDASSSIFGRLVYDLCKKPLVYKSLRDAYLTEKADAYELPDDNVTFIHLPKPFLLLAGISGTGKTRFVREQARYGAYKLVAVRPDWHEPGDLLGYETRLTESGNPEYVSTEVLKFIAAAWKELVDNGFDLEACERDGINSIHVSGEQGALSSVRAHWLCLDEMNLAPVEQYFSDYLSVLETRKWHKDDSSFTYSCDALLDSGKLNVGGTKLRKDLGLEGLEFDELWELFSKIGLPVPLNLIVAGTVNMDETTHGFSR